MNKYIYIIIFVFIECNPTTVKIIINVKTYIVIIHSPSIVSINRYVQSNYYTHGGMKTGGLIRKRVLSMTSSRGTAHKKIKVN